MAENEDNDKLSAVEKGGSNYVIDNNIYILGGFDDSISKGIIPNILPLIEQQKARKNGQINFLINSYGGYAKELYGLLAMVDMAKSEGIKITTFVLAHAYSCGSLLAVMGDERKMYRYADHLMHFGSTGDINETPEQLERNTKHQKEFFDNTVRMYAEHTKMRESVIRRKMSDDCFFLNADECLRYGLVDEIV